MQRIKTWIRENPHVWWALVLPVYLTLFFIIEHFIKDNYWATQTSIDYHIPFIPQFIVIYDSWSFLLFALGIYLIVKDPEGFRRYMWTILLTFFTATAFCALVPNGQDLRRRNSRSTISSSGSCSAFIPLTPTRTCCPVCTSSAARR